MPLLAVDNLSKRFIIEGSIFGRKAGVVNALDHASFSLDEGKVLGILGESGSGKSTLARLICRLMTPDSGSIILDGRPLNEYSRGELSTKVQMVFQDPFASLNPKLTIGTILREAVSDKADAEPAIRDALRTVGLPENILALYPHQFSGGQRQRIAIARALIKKPKIIIADEPLSSLDISIQNQLLDLFLMLKNMHSVSFIFISHDIVTMSTLADDIIVMKDGLIVERGTAREVICNPQTPYTRRLLSAVPGFESSSTGMPA